MVGSKIILVANTSWFLYNFLRPLIADLRSSGLDVVAAAPIDDTTPLLEGLGVRFIEVPMSRRGINPFAEVRLLLRLAKLYRCERPDYIFHNTIKPVIFGSIAARWTKQGHVFNMIPGLGYVFAGNGLSRRLLRYVATKMYRISLKGCRRIFFQNPDDKAFFEENRIVEKGRGIVTYGLGVDLDRFHFVEPKLRGSECTFLLMARMLWDKGVGDFVAAAKVIKKSAPHVRFQLLGRIDMDNPSGIKPEKIQEWVRLGYIEYLGEVQDVRSILALADVVVLPSAYREGIPNALMEAMAMGKPVITTTMPGCRETVVDGINGILVPPHDVGALVEAMNQMIKCPDRRVKMAYESRRLAVEKFDVNRVNSLIIKALNTP